MFAWLISQQYFSLRTNQLPATSQQHFSFRTNQHQPSATSQTNSLTMEYSSADFFNNISPTLAIVLPDLFPFVGKIQML
jgi:hypothetical protein